MPYFAKACISLLLYGASATLNKFYLLMNGIDFAVEVGQEPRQVKKGNFPTRIKDVCKKIPFKFSKIAFNDLNSARRYFHSTYTEISIYRTYIMKL